MLVFILNLVLKNDSILPNDLIGCSHGPTQPTNDFWGTHAHVSFLYTLTSNLRHFCLAGRWIVVLQTFDITIAAD